MAIREKTNGKERLRVALGGGVTDRAAWSPCITPYYLHSHPRHATITQLEALRECGADVLLRFGPLSVQGYMDHPDVKIETETAGDETRQTTVTPVGRLTARFRMLPTSSWLPFIVEHPVKSIDDMKVLLWIEEHRVWNPRRDFEAFLAAEKEVGDDGFVTESVPCSAFRMLIEHLAGIEAFYELLTMYPEEVEAWMNLYHEHHKRFYELLAESPAEVVIGYENTSVSTTSPAYYRRYVKGHLDDYADIVRAAGKIYLNHDCGTLMALAGDIRDGHQNGRIDVARAPTGDFDFARRLELTGDKVMIGGIDATAFTSLGPAEMRAHVREFLAETAPWKCFILGSGDAVPCGTPPEVLAAVGETVREGRL